MSGDTLAVMADFKVYADESGIHDSAEWLVFAGWLNKANRWQSFERAWRKALCEFDVYDFHSKDFFAFGPGGERKGKHRRFSDPREKRPYSEWSEEKALSFLTRLIRIIGGKGLSPIGAALEVAAFTALTYGERKHLTGAGIRGGAGKKPEWLSHGAPSRPYFLLFNHMVADAAETVKVGKKVRFVLDKQKVYEGGVLNQFATFAVAKGVRRRIRRSLGGVTFQSRADAGALQAADLWAHCWQRYLSKEGDVGEARGLAVGLFIEEGFERMPTLVSEELDRLLSPPHCSEVLRAWLRGVKKPQGRNEG